MARTEAELKARKLDRITKELSAYEIAAKSKSKFVEFYISKVKELKIKREALL